MVLKLREIRPLDDNHYEVLYDYDDDRQQQIVIVCTVVERRGISLVKMKPNIFVGRQPLAADCREMVSAVLHYHQQRGRA